MPGADRKAASGDGPQDLPAEGNRRSSTTPAVRSSTRATGPDDGDDGPAALAQESAAAKLASAVPPPIDQTERDDVMATIRELFAAGGPRTSEDAIRALARALGYGRLGAKIASILKDDLRTAIRRGILQRQSGELSLLCRAIGEYDRDHLVRILLAAMGPNWQSRREAIRVAARNLGYRRTGQQIQAAFKSAINAAIRRGRVERDGQRIRRRR